MNQHEKGEKRKCKNEHWLLSALKLSKSYYSLQCLSYQRTLRKDAGRHVYDAYWYMYVACTDECLRIHACVRLRSCTNSMNAFAFTLEDFYYGIGYSSMWMLAGVSARASFKGCFQFRSPPGIVAGLLQRPMCSPEPRNRIQYCR